MGAPALKEETVGYKLFRDGPGGVAVEYLGASLARSVTDWFEAFDRAAGDEARPDRLLNQIIRRTLPLPDPQSAKARKLRIEEHLVAARMLVPPGHFLAELLYLAMLELEQHPIPDQPA